MRCPPDLRELFNTIYGLSGAESEVLVKVCEEDWRTSELAEELGKDRSTVQRYLSRLRSAGLVERRSVNEDGKKGRHYVYSVQSGEELKKKVKDRLDKWEDEKMASLEEI